MRHTNTNPGSSKETAVERPTVCKSFITASVSKEPIRFKLLGDVGFSGAASVCWVAPISSAASSLASLAASVEPDRSKPPASVLLRALPANRVGGACWSVCQAATSELERRTTGISLVGEEMAETAKD